MGWTKIRRRCLPLGLALIVLLLTPTPSSAYEDDTHYILTYVICRSVGFTHDEAMTVAIADVAMDDSDNTVAAGSPTGASPHLHSQWMWHALDYGTWNGPNPWNTIATMGTSGILEQKNLLFQVAQDQWLNIGSGGTLTEADKQQRLFLLGVFFHYQQDTWAHRIHYDPRSGLTRKGFKAFTTPMGHVTKSHVHEPDRPPYDPLAALTNLKDGIIYARTFLRNVLHRQPNAFFVNDDFVDTAEIVDSTWDKRNPVFNNVKLAYPKIDKSMVRRYLTALIRAQIDTYTNGQDPLDWLFVYENGTGKTLWTQAVRLVGSPDLANLQSVVNAFARVCNEYKDTLGLGDIFPNTNTFLLDRKAKALPNGRFHDNVTSEYVVSMMGGWQEVLGFPDFTRTSNWPIPTDVDLWEARAKPSRSLQEITGAWTLAPKPDGPSVNPVTRIISVTVMKDGKILGVGENHLLYGKENLEADWALVPNTGLFNAVTTMPDGSILGIGWPGKTLRICDKSKLKDSWKQSFSPQLYGQFVQWDNDKAQAQVDVVTVLPNGTVWIAVHKHDNSVNFYTKAAATARWELVEPDHTIVKSMTALPDGGILGISSDGTLVLRATVESPSVGTKTFWKRAPNCNAFTYVKDRAVYGNTIVLKAVTTMPDGRLLGLSEAGQLLIKGKGAAWAIDDPDRHPNPNGL
jgi:hypothetical protein